MGLNNIVKIISIVMAIAVISSTSQAYTVSGTLDTPKVGIYTYSSTLDHKEEIAYEQSSTAVVLDQKINGKKETFKIVETPGKDASGYSKMIIKRIDEKNVVIEVDRTEYPDKITPVNLKYTATGTFVKGTWSDMLNNMPIQIALTAEGAARTKSKIKLFLEMFIKSKANEKFEKLGWMAKKVVGSAFKQAQIIDNTFNFKASVLEGTKAELKQQFKINTLFKVYN